MKLWKEVFEIKSKVSPDSKNIVLDFDFSNDNEPHGFLNGSRLHLVIDENRQEKKCCEAVDTETELTSNRKYYLGVISKPTNKFMKEPTHPSHSFEGFVEVHRCKCGKHGPDVNRPFLGEWQSRIE